MQKTIKKALGVLIVVIYAILLIYQVANSWSYNLGDAEMVIPNNGVVGIIDERNTSEQTFIVKDDFRGVSVLMANYGLPKIGWADVKITNCETDEIVFQDTLWFHLLKDNELKHFISDSLIEVDKETKFKITIDSKFSLYQGITVWCSSEDAYEDGEMYYAGERCEGDWCFMVVEEYEAGFQAGMILKRFLVLSIPLLFIVANLVIDRNVLYDFIYKKRVWIAIIIFAICVLNKFHFSSFAIFDRYIESGQGTQYITPVFGTPRDVRADEWSVTLPRLLSAEYSDYGKYNDIVRATETTNLSASGLYLDYSALAKPADWGFYLFGSEYGLSFMWCFKMIFGFLFTFELCMLLTKGKKLHSVLGATIIWWSAYNMWWSIAPWILTGSAAIVLFHHFLHADKKRKQLLYGIGVAIFGANFCVDLYPAWQVPAGYIFLMLLIWVFVEAKEKWKKFSLANWGIGFGCIGFMVSLIVAYFYNYLEYMTAIMNTEYPGSRVDYGGYNLGKLLGYFSSTLAASTKAVTGTVCEEACFFAVFPLGIILAIIVLYRKKGKDLLLWLLLIPSMLFLCYCTFPLPEVIAKYTLMTFSTRMRAADILGFTCALLMVIALSEFTNTKKLNWKIGIPIVLICTGAAFVSEILAGATGVELRKIAILAIITSVLLIMLIVEIKAGIDRIAMISISLIVFIFGVQVHPLMSGLDAIYSRPVAKAVAEIVEEDPDAKWIATDSLFNGDFIIALGARTYNSTNYIPNMEFWNVYDPNGEKEEIYNRYAHIMISMTSGETNAELWQADLIMLYMSYSDIKELGIKYIISICPMEDNEYYNVIELYSGKDIYIYKCEY